MPFYNIVDWQVQYVAPLKLLRVEWVGGRNLSRLRTTLELLQQLAKELQVTRVQLDLNSLPDLPVFDQLWLGATWMPTVLPLPLQQVVLVLGPAHGYNAQAIEMLLAAFKTFIRFDLQFFTQPEAGLQWLVPNDPPALAYLLAEWQRASQPGGAESDSFAESQPTYGPLNPLALPT